MELKPPTSNRAVFLLLWKAARRRAAGRRNRQRELMQQKTKKSGGNPLSGIMSFFTLIIMVVVHAALGWMLAGSLETARLLDSEAGGKLVVPDYAGSSLESLSESEDLTIRHADQEEMLKEFADTAGGWRETNLGGTEAKQGKIVTDHFRRHGADGFILESDFDKISDRNSGGFPPSCLPVVGFVFLWWLVMIVCQGEGLELDIQRRRHPMWEWVQGHPVRPVAAFAADLLSPMMANPVYFSAPVFWWIVLGSRFDFPTAAIGGLLIGLAFSVAASCMNKALEISAMLRLAPRNRGALLGLTSWLGYAAMMLPLFSLNAPALKFQIAKLLAPLADVLPLWPVRALVFGWGNAPAGWQVTVSGVLLAALLLAGAVATAWWAANQGLQAGGGSNTPGNIRRVSSGGRGLLAGKPLYRKELLWFWRDKGAVVQAVLIPLTIASFQVFNLRGLLNSAVGSWNGICGAAIICGTYFLIVLGPRSLASEGGALWIATTWPQGMEDLLKAKARLWWMLSNAVVALMLLAAGFMFPADWWRISLVAVGWLFFGRSLAEKTVTLATAPSSSGEPEPPAKGRTWAAMLGTLAFSSGVITGTWSIAIMGVVFSSLTAAAMWQNFRARLPFLFDPWSEKLPQAPTLMHAMIGIAGMVEVISLVTGITVGFGGSDQLWKIRVIAYGCVGLLAWIIMHRFLSGRDVSAASIWRWHGKKPLAETALAYTRAALTGAALAGLAVLYLMALRALPITHDFMVVQDKMRSASQADHLGIILLAVGMAPFAEEYFFRGLLYRALDREWGGWRALVGSAAYFAIYHPPLSWLPVFALGACSAWSFRKSGLLGPCVIMHMVYNAIIVG